VTLLYHESDPARVELLFNGTSHGMLTPLDVRINAKVKRFCQAVEIVAERESTKETTRYRGGQLFGKEEE
jgi:putative transposase